MRAVNEDVAVLTHHSLRLAHILAHGQKCDGHGTCKDGPSQREPRHLYEIAQTRPKLSPCAASMQAQPFEFGEHCGG